MQMPERISPSLLWGVYLLHVDFRTETYSHDIAAHLAQKPEEMIGIEARPVVPCHVQRSGTPSAYGRLLSNNFGVHAVKLP